MAKKKRQGHYCKICGETKANEKFTGKGHAKHICKLCQSQPAKKQTEVIHSENIDESFEEDYDVIYDYYTDIDTLPVFSEKKKFKELDSEYKALLREYIRRKVSEYLTTYKKIPKEHELIEIRKQMIQLFEEEYNVILKSNPILRQFLADNADAIINKREKEMEDNN